MGLPDIARVIRNANTRETVSVNLAAAYGNLTAASFKRMDKELKIVIGYTVAKIAALGGSLGWYNVVRCMNENKLLKVKNGTQINRSDSHNESGTGVFKTDGSPNSAVVRTINAWFTRLVSDSDVLRDTGIDINFMGRLVAETGASIDSFESFFYKKVTNRRDVMDVNVLRYPDLDRPYFKVYQITLNAWRTCERILFVQNDWGGINGVFRSVCYEPRSSVIRGLKEDVIKTAVKEAEDLFS